MGRNRFIARAALVALSLSGAAAAQPTARFADPQPPSRARPSPPAPRPEPQESWARSAARRLLERAERYERRGDTADAMRVYNDAIRMDPSFGAAYLALGRLRHATRDFAEAERLYTAAARLPDSAAEALERRAHVRRDAGREQEAVLDLQSAVELEPLARRRLETLAAWYVERRAWPAALGVWRRLAALLEREGASDALRRAEVQIKALSLLAGDADPVAAGSEHPSWVRRSMARIATGK